MCTVELRKKPGPKCVAVSYDSVLQCVAVCCSVLPCVAVCCSMLQSAAVCCIVTYVYHRIEEKGWSKVWYWCHARLCCNVLQCVAMYVCA